MSWLWLHVCDLGFNSNWDITIIYLFMLEIFGTDYVQSFQILMILDNGYLWVFYSSIIMGFLHYLSFWCGDFRYGFCPTILSIYVSWLWLHVSVPRLKIAREVFIHYFRNLLFFQHFLLFLFGSFINVPIEINQW